MNSANVVLFNSSSNTSACLTLDRGDYKIANSAFSYTASGGMDEFCRSLVELWPVESAMCFKWLKRRLEGHRMLYTDTDQCLVAPASGQPVNMFGEVDMEPYAPVDDWDNMVDCIMCVKQTYTQI